MSSDPKDQKTAILQEAPPEVKKLAPQSAAPGGMASSLPPPPAPPPPSGGAAPSSQKTVMVDVAAPAAPARQAVVPTMMKERPQGSLPPVRKPQREAAWGRWIAGPLLAAVVAIGTAALAGVVMPGKRPPAPKPQGRLRVNSDPIGAELTVNGKRFPHFTPTTVEGDVGATLHLGFAHDGFSPKEVDVYIAAGDHPFAIKLDALAAPPPAPAPVPAPPPKPEHHHHAEKKVAAGTGTISVFVRPWAIVYVDGTRLRQTPVENFSLPSGKHTIELVNEIQKRREKVPLTLKPGETEEIRRDWDQ